MSRAECYVLDMYCDNAEAHKSAPWTARDQFTGPDKAATDRQAKAAGWRMSRDRTHDLCPTCNKKAASRAAWCGAGGD